MTKAEKKVCNAMRQLNKAFAELHKEQGRIYTGFLSACRIEHKDYTYYNIFGEIGPFSTDRLDYTWTQEK